MSLFDALKRSLIAIPSSHDRDRVLELMSKAVRYELAETAIHAISDVVDYIPQSIERNLDFISPFGDVVWFEFEQAPRLSAPEADLKAGVTRTPDLVGCLVAKNPDDADAAIMLTAWSFEDGSVHHSYALIRWFWPNFEWLAKMSRARLSPAPEYARERMLQIVDVFIPDGLQAELLEWSSYNEDEPGDGSLEARSLLAKQDVVSEYLFCLAALLMMQSATASLTPREESTLLEVQNWESHGVHAGFMRHGDALYLEPRPEVAHAV